MLEKAGPSEGEQGEIDKTTTEASTESNSKSYHGEEKDKIVTTTPVQVDDAENIMATTPGQVEETDKIVKAAPGQVDEGSTESSKDASTESSNKSEHGEEKYKLVKVASTTATTTQVEEISTEGSRETSTESSNKSDQGEETAKIVTTTPGQVEEASTEGQKEAPTESSNKGDQGDEKDKTVKAVPGQVEETDKIEGSTTEKPKSSVSVDLFGPKDVNSMDPVLNEMTANPQFEQNNPTTENDSSSASANK